MPEPTRIARPLLFLASLSFSLCLGCDGDPPPGVDLDTSSTSTTTSDTTTSESGESEGSCFDAPELCLKLVECIDAIAPSQSESAAAQFGEDGSCWCGTEDEAQACYETCFNQLELALENYPTEPACQDSYCTLDELDAEQPYGKPVDGACPNWGNDPQLVADAPLGLPGSVCMPECSGIAKYCPEHSQSSAEGVCYLASGGVDYCALRCWVDSTVVGGTQCPCGARCQPHGAPDGEGNQRGICTFE